MVQAKKKFGQNFLVSQFHLNLLEKQVIKLLDILKPEQILEIGPGMGALTKIIIQNAGNTKFEAWEIDPEAIAFLENNLKFQDKIIFRDAFGYIEEQNKQKQNLYEEKYVLISNLPYNIGSRILVDLTRQNNPPIGFLVMLQKEVGQKLLGKTKDLNVLGGFLRLYYEFELAGNFPPSAFSPQPNVDSVLIQAVFKENLDSLFLQNAGLVLTILKNLLKYPSKTLANNLKNLDFDKTKIQAFLAQNKLDSNFRLSWQNYEEVLRLVVKEV